jgi:hypothetical protein
MSFNISILQLKPNFVNIGLCTIKKHLKIGVFVITYLSPVPGKNIIDGF